MGPEMSISRRLAWPDTDGAGQWHHSTVWRWVEEAEAEMHRYLEITAHTFGFTPRRYVEAEFFRPVLFDQIVTITIRVQAVGRTSVTYVADVAQEEAAVARVLMTAVLVSNGTPRAWPKDLGERLRRGWSD